MNVNSLRNKTELISTELGDHDIICITESRLNNTVSSSDITIDNFINPEAFRKDRLTDSGGGILIYIRNTLLGRRRLDLEVPEAESVCLEMFADNNFFFISVLI
jgi:exonuclease III